MTYPTPSCCSGCGFDSVVTLPSLLFEKQGVFGIRQHGLGAAQHGDAERAMDVIRRVESVGSPQGAGQHCTALGLCGGEDC